MTPEHRYDYILAIDPSGNFNEGHGTTGWSLIDYNTNLIECDYISAIGYDCSEEYWNAHVELITKFSQKYHKKLMVVIEDYKLYQNRSQSQINSKMETCRLIGLLQWHCWKLGQPYTLQMATQVKNRWSDKVLFTDNIIYREGNKIIHNPSKKPITLCHIRDSFRHAMHYATFKNLFKNEPVNRTYNTYRPKGRYSRY